MEDEALGIAFLAAGRPPEANFKLVAVGGDQ
jgi:hypothetical protein